MGICLWTLAVLQTRGILVNVKCHARMDGYHDGVDQPLPGSFWVGRGISQKYKPCWGPWDYGVTRRRASGWMVTMMELASQGRIPMGTRWCLIGSPIESCSSPDFTKMHTKIWPLIAKNMHRGGSAKNTSYAGGQWDYGTLRWLSLESYQCRIPMGTRWCLIGKNLVWRYEWVNEAVIQREMLCAVVDP